MRLKLQTYALTTVAHQRKRLFQRDANAELFIQTLFRYRDAGKFLLHGFVVMPDHVHIVLTPASNVAIERCAQLIKGGFSFAVRKQFAGEVWQEGYHAHRVTDAADLRNQMAYVAQNALRKKLIDYPHVHTAVRFSSRMDPPTEV